MPFNTSNGEALQWVTTSEAARQLQVSETTLRRWRDRESGLIPGTHYKRGLYRNTPCRWNVSKIVEFVEANAYTRPAKGGEA